MKRVLPLILVLAGSPQLAQAEPYPLSPPQVIASAPCDHSSQRTISGGVVDLRYGQAAIRSNGTGYLLDWTDETLFSLDASPAKAEELVALVEAGTGLTAALLYCPDSGQISRFDAVSSRPVPAITTTIEPNRSPFLYGDQVQISVSRSELDRLALQNPTLMIPGAVHDLSFTPVGERWVARLPIKRGWNWKAMPIFIRGDQGEAFRGNRLSVATDKPTLGAVGPQRASQHLKRIPGWVELDGNTDFLDPLATQLTISEGGRIIEVIPRAGRIDFVIEVDGPGAYLIQAEIADLIGRRDQTEWQLLVTP